MRLLRNGGALVIHAEQTEVDRRPAPLQIPQGPRTGLLALLHTFIVLLLLAGGIAGMLFEVKADALLTPLSVTLLLLFAWIIASWKMVRGSVYNFYGLFVCAAMPFHGGFAILHVLSTEKQLGLLGDFSDATIAETLAFVIIAFALFHLGALLAVLTGAKLDTERRIDTSAQATDSLYLVGWALLGISGVPQLLQFKNAIVTVVTQGYMGLFENRVLGTSTEGALMLLLSSFFLTGVMFLLAGSRGRWLGKVVSAGGIFMFSLSYLFLGNRAYAMFPLVAYVWLWHHSIRRLPIFPIGMSGAALFLFIAPLIRHMRHLSGAERLSPVAWMEAYTSAENPVFSLLAELGGTMLTVSYTMDFLPEMRPYAWGMGYLQTLFNAIPILDIPYAYDDFGNWLSWEVRPNWAAGGWGIGFSFIAEAYGNFSWVGGPLFLGLMGFGIVKFAQWGLHGDPARLAVLAAFMPKFLFFVRAESIDLSRPLLWYTMLPFLAVLIVRYFMHKLSVEAATGVAVAGPPVFSEPHSQPRSLPTPQGSMLPPEAPRPSLPPPPKRFPAS